MTLPSLVYHADWSTSPEERWAVKAVLVGERYEATAPEPVEDPETLIAGLAASANGAVVAGFDFPIGVPVAWARKVGVRSFRSLLPVLGRNEWSEFFVIADSPEAIRPRRPFYPVRSNGTKQADLCRALGVSHIDDLRRRCELRGAGRRAAAPLFWTLGGNQVGRAAISGWRDLLQPALREDTGLALWPFDGDLQQLARERAPVVAETYPAEFYAQLKIRLGRAGKTKLAGRKPAVAPLQRLVRVLEISLGDGLATELAHGFTDDDRFDAFVGLVGMINVLRGRRSAGEPPDAAVRAVEGWMLGQRW